MSFPGTAQQKAQKAAFMDRCTSCHTYERIAKSTYNADEFIKVLQRMGTYAPGTTPYEPQKRKETRAEMDPERLRPRAEFLASINLSESQTWEYPLKTLPRLKGRSTKVVITEYDLPRERAMPHDVILDDQGMAWYTDFGHQFLGKLDPKTGKVTEYHGADAQARLPARHARYRHRQERRPLGRPDAAGRHREIRSQDREVHDVSAAAGHQQSGRAAGDGDAVVVGRGRQGLDEQRRHSRRAPHGPRHA